MLECSSRNENKLKGIAGLRCKLENKLQDWGKCFLNSSLSNNKKRGNNHGYLFLKSSFLVKICSRREVALCQNLPKKAPLSWNLVGLSTLLIEFEFLGQPAYRIWLAQAPSSWNLIGLSTLISFFQIHSHGNNRNVNCI